MRLTRIAAAAFAGAMALALWTFPSGESRAQSAIACGSFYTIVPGDTLREIALRAYGSGNYQIIFSANSDILTRPSLLLVDQRIFIPCADGTGPQTRQAALAAEEAALEQGPAVVTELPDPASVATEAPEPVDEPAAETEEIAVEDATAPEITAPEVPEEGAEQDAAEQDAAEEEAIEEVAGIPQPPVEGAGTGGDAPRTVGTGELLPTPPTAPSEGDRPQPGTTAALGQTESGTGAAPASSDGAGAGIQPAPGVSPSGGIQPAPGATRVTGVQPAPSPSGRTGVQPDAGSAAGSQPSVAAVQPAAGERGGATGALGLQPAPGARPTGTAGGAQPPVAPNGTPSRNGAGGAAGIQPTPEATGAASPGIQPAPGAGATNGDGGSRPAGGGLAIQPAPGAGGGGAPQPAPGASDGTSAIQPAPGQSAVQPAPGPRGPRSAGRAGGVQPAPGQGGQAASGSRRLAQGVQPAPSSATRAGRGEAEVAQPPERAETGRAIQPAAGDDRGRTRPIIIATVTRTDTPIDRTRPIGPAAGPAAGPGGERTGAGAGPAPTAEAGGEDDADAGQGDTEIAALTPGTGAPGGPGDAATVGADPDGPAASANGTDGDAESARDRRSGETSGPSLARGLAGAPAFPAGEATPRIASAADGGELGAVTRGGGSSTLPADPSIPSDPSQTEAEASAAETRFTLPGRAGRQQASVPQQPQLSVGPVQPLPRMLPLPEPEAEPEEVLAVASPAASDRPAGDVAETPSPLAIRLLTHEIPPYSGRDLRAQGMLTEVLRRALEISAPRRDAVVTFDDAEARHLTELLPSGAFDLGYPWFRPDCAQADTLSPDMRLRCTDYVWSLPLHELVIGYFVAAGSELAGADDYDALLGRSICRPQGSYTFDLDQKGLSEPAVTMIFGEDATDCIRRLATREVDVVSLGLTETEEVLADLDLVGFVSEIPALADILTLHAVAPRSNPVARPYLTLVNRGLREMRQSGEWFRVVARHLAEHSARIR